MTNAIYMIHIMIVVLYLALISTGASRGFVIINIIILSSLSSSRRSSLDLALISTGASRGFVPTRLHVRPCWWEVWRNHLKENHDDHYRHQHISEAIFDLIIGKVPPRSWVKSPVPPPPQGPRCHCPCSRWCCPARSSWGSWLKNVLY